MKFFLNLIKYIIEYFFVKSLFIFINLMPVTIASKFGGFIFKFIGSISSYNSTALKNCRYVFPKLEENHIKKIVSESWENLGKTIFELGKLKQIIKNEKFIEIKGHEHISKILENQSQAIFIGIHQSNWEIGVPLLDKLGLRVGAIYRHINNYLIDKYIFKKRSYSLTSKNSFYTPKGKRSAKEIIEGIKNKCSVFILIDQKDSAGENISLFNKNVKTQIGFLKIARKYKMPIIPVQNKRLTNGKFLINFCKPIYNNEAKINDKEMMLKIHGIIEEWIKSNPSQWFWQHNRFN